MPKELLIANTVNEKENEENPKIEEASMIESLKAEDDTTTLEEINKLKETISSTSATTDDKNKAFDTLKTLNQISSKEELLEEKIKLTYNLDSFIKIEDDQIRVVVNSEEHTTKLANDIMRTIQDNFDTKQYIVVQFK
jgi:stage III sporulation protein AH